MGGPSRKEKKRKLQRQRIKQLGANINELKGAATKDETISDITRQEILGVANTKFMGTTSEALSQIGSAAEKFKQAKEGSKPIFKRRQFLQQQTNLIKDQPGKRQTILT